MSDNIVSFTKPFAVDPPKPDVDDEAQRELEECAANAISFLADSMDKLQHFVLAVVTKEPDAEGQGDFNLMTSRLSVSDFALVIAMMNKSLNRHL